MTSNSSGKEVAVVPPREAQIAALASRLNMTRVETIESFGSHIFDTIQEISRQISKKTLRDTMAGDPMSGVTGELGDINPDSLVGKANKFMKARSIDADKDKSAGVQGAVYRSPLGKFLAAAGVGSAAYTREAQKIKDEAVGQQELEDDLRTFSLKLSRVKASLRETRQRIPVDIKAVEKLSAAREEVSVLLELHMEAAQRKRTEFMAGDMKKIQARGSQGFVAQQELVAASDAVAALDNLMTVFSHAKADLVTKNQLLTDIATYYKNVQRVVDEHMTVSVPQWDLMLGQVATILRLAEIEENIQEAAEATEKRIDRLSRTTEAKLKNAGDDAEKRDAIIRDQQAQLELIAKHVGSLESVRTRLQQKLMDQTQKLAELKSEQMRQKAVRIVSSSAVTKEGSSGPSKPKI